MKDNPRFMVFRLKELIYTGIFIVLGIFLIILMIHMFGSKGSSGKNASAGELSTTSADSVKSASAQYIPGVYTSSLTLNNSTLEIQVCVDATHINSVSINNLDEAVTTMYPLILNSVNDIANQIVNTQSLDNITYTEDCRYTYIILLDAIETTLNKARPAS